MRFSQRIGKKPIRSAIQIESMDDDLRNSLWNVFREFAFGKIVSNENRILFPAPPIFWALWIDFLKKPLGTSGSTLGDAEGRLNQWFFREAQWYEIYDFMEFVSRNALQQLGIDANEIRKRCNEILERELSGYRFVGDYLAPITTETELKEIEEVLGVSEENQLNGVKEHVSAALAKLSDRKEPDYRNSIKESISAVESISKVISGDPKADLGKALKIIKTKIGLHAALEQGFLKIYGYTSDEGGIRHALLEESNCDFHDAKYMLVSCSAFINYLIMKSQKAGIF